VKHVDFDAPTREGAQLLPDDKVGYYHLFQMQCEDPSHRGANVSCCI